MLSFLNILPALGLFIVSVQGSYDNGEDAQSLYNDTTIIQPVCTENITVTDYTTILSSVLVPVTEYVDTTVFHHVNVTVNSTETNIETSTIVTCITESTTTTLLYTISHTETDLETVTNTDTDLETITNTETTTNTVPATVTTYTTETIFSTTYDPCPTTCSVSAATVTLFYWPTDRPYNYPSTYVDEERDYTFKSPSVYMLIPSIVGINTAGETVGPSTTDWILELDLDEVSTIADGPDGSITEQLTLSDLGTDCPQSVDPTAIATLSDSRCAPILAAPDQVSTWASPCNACGQFGLFDPPYAIPTITGDLVQTTAEESPPAETTEEEPSPSPPSPPSEQPEGLVLIVSYVDGTPVGTGTMTVIGATGTMTTSVDVPAITSSDAPSMPSSEVPSSPDGSVTENPPATIPPGETTLPPGETTPPVVTALAPKVTSSGLWMTAAAIVAVFLF